MKIRIDDIIRSDTVQSRIALNELTVFEYQFRKEDGDEFPPIVVFVIDGKFYVVDGFHRLEAYRRAGHTEIECVVHDGDWAAALRFESAIFTFSWYSPG